MKTRHTILIGRNCFGDSFSVEKIFCMEFAEQNGQPECKSLKHWFNAESMAESHFGYGTDHREYDFIWEGEQ